MHTALIVGPLSVLPCQEDGVSDHEAGAPLRQAGHCEAQEGTSPRR